MIRTYAAAVLLGVLSASLATAYETWAYRGAAGHLEVRQASQERGALVVQRPDGALCTFGASATGHSLSCR